MFGLVRGPGRENWSTEKENREKLKRHRQESRGTQRKRETGERVAVLPPVASGFLVSVLVKQDPHYTLGSHQALLCLPDACVLFA